MHVKVLRATGVSHVNFRTDPPITLIIARGIVPTTHWTDAQLVPYVYISPPSGGVLDFDFIARAPEGHAHRVDTEIVGYWEGVLPGWARKVRIHASEGDIVHDLATPDSSADDGVRIAGGEIPWPLVAMA